MVRAWVLAWVGVARAQAVAYDPTARPSYRPTSAPVSKGNISALSPKPTAAAPHGDAPSHPPTAAPFSSAPTPRPQHHENGAMDDDVHSFDDDDDDDDDNDHHKNPHHLNDGMYDDDLNDDGIKNDWEMDDHYDDHLNDKAAWRNNDKVAWHNVHDDYDDDDVSFHHSGGYYGKKGSMYDDFGYALHDNLGYAPIYYGYEDVVDDKWKEKYRKGGFFLDDDDDIYNPHFELDDNGHDDHHPDITGLISERYGWALRDDDILDRRPDVDSGDDDYENTAYYAYDADDNDDAYDESETLVAQYSYEVHSVRDDRNNRDDRVDRYAHSAAEIMEKVAAEGFGCDADNRVTYESTCDDCSCECSSTQFAKDSYDASVIARVDGSCNAVWTYSCNALVLTAFHCLYRMSYTFPTCGHVDYDFEKKGCAYYEPGEDHHRHPQTENGGVGGEDDDDDDDDDDDGKAAAAVPARHAGAPAAPAASPAAVAFEDDIDDPHVCRSTLQGYVCAHGACAVGGNVRAARPMAGLAGDVLACAIACDGDGRCTGFDFEPFAGACSLDQGGIDSVVYLGGAPICFVNDRARAVAAGGDSDGAARRGSPALAAVAAAAALFLAWPAS